MADSTDHTVIAVVLRVREGRLEPLLRRIERRSIRARAEIGEQKKATRDVGGNDVRHMKTRLFQNACDMDVRAAILLRRRSIHRDQRGCIAGRWPRLRERYAKVATETRVGGSGSDRCDGNLQRRGEPMQQLLLIFPLLRALSARLPLPRLRSRWRANTSRLASAGQSR